MSDKLYMSANEYEADNSRGAKNFAKEMEQAHGKNVVVSATYNGQPVYVKNGKTYVRTGRNPKAAQAGFDWVERLRKMQNNE